MSYIAERRLEEKERRRTEILDAAEGVLSRLGYEQTTMEQVARQARVSRALLYVYFPDKQALLFGISTRALELLRDRFAAAAARHPRGYEQVQAIGRAYLAVSQEFPHYFEALTRFEAHSPAEIDANSTEAGCVLAGDAVHTVTAAAVALGMSDGSIRIDVGNPHLVAVTLWGFLHGVIQLGQTKANVLAHDGISVQQLLDQGMKMCCAAIAGPKALTP